MTQKEFLDDLRLPTIEEIRERRKQASTSTLWYNEEQSQPHALAFHIEEYGYWEADQSWARVRSSSTDKLMAFVRFVEARAGRKIPTREELRRMWPIFKEGGEK